MSSLSSLGSSPNPVIIHDTSPQTPRNDSQVSKSPRSPRSADSSPRGSMLSPRSLFGAFGAIVRSPEQKTPEKVLNLTDRATFKELSEEEEAKFQKLVVYILHKCIDHKHWSRKSQSQPATTFSPSARSESFFKQMSVSSVSEALQGPLSAREIKTPRNRSMSKSKPMDGSKLSEAIKKCWAKVQQYFPHPKKQSSPVISNGELRTRLQEALAGYMTSETIEVLQKIEGLFQELAKASDADQQVVVAKDQMVQAISESVKNSIVHYHVLGWIEKNMDVKYIMGLRQMESDPLSCEKKRLLATKFKEFANLCKDSGMEFLLFVQEFERIENPVQALTLLEHIERTYLPTETLSNFLMGNPKEINVDLTENVSTLKRIKKQIHEFKEARKKGETFVIPANLFTENFKTEIIGGLEKNFMNTKDRNFFHSEAWKQFGYAMYKMKP